MKTPLLDLTDKTLDALVKALERKHAGESGVVETLTRLNKQDFSQYCKPKVLAKRDPACRHLAAGLAAAWHIDKNLSTAIGNLTPLLHWQRIPEHVPWPPGSFMDDYTFAQIIGPNGVYPGDDFMLGLFVIGPRQFYPDHFHAAPEFYWRFSAGGPWIVKKAAELQWHKSYDSHAIRTSNVPLFSLWVWTRDIDGDFSILGADGKSPFNQPAAL